MRHPDAGVARFPRSAVQHWSGHGWVECDPPAKPPRPERRTGKRQRARAPRPTSSPAQPVKSTPVDAPPDMSKKPVSKTPKAPSGRKED
jgi:hypothetical protein